MKYYASAITLFFALSTHPAMCDSGGQSIECKEITARVVQMTNANFDHFSPSGDNVFFKNSGNNELVLSCINHYLTGISLNWDKSGYPPNDWFVLASRAGQAVTGVDAKKVERAIRNCHLSALKDPSELAELTIPKAKIECQAFVRDGGGVNVSVYINDGNR
jgi:hypothetical protein